jgi:GDP-L-fucose synthase
MKILITGASGFIGKALGTALEEHGHEVVRLNSATCDLRRQGALEQMKHPAYDRIYHLAAWTRAGEFCLHHAGEQWIVNQQINTNMLAWWQAFQPQAKLIAMGTSVSYPKGVELAEENYMTGEPIDRFYAYAMSKRMLYAGLMTLRQEFGLRYLYLVPSTVYGPGYHLDGRDMHFVYDLARKILRGKYYGEPVVLWGDGMQKRELVFIDECLAMMLRLSDTVENDIVNLGAGGEHTIREFAEEICRIVGYDALEIRYDTERYVGVKSKILSVKKLDKLFPDLQRTGFSEGIRQTVEWVIKERDILVGAR